MVKHTRTIEQNVINFIKRTDLLIDAKSVLITLSGGADSVFCLTFFHKFAKKYRIQISAIHVNHQLRGGESKRDEEFSKKLCKKLNIDFYSCKVNVKQFARENKKSIEESARELRYSQFEKIASKINSDLIITAHNQNDNSETVLLNLISGAGLQGISGIPVKREKYIRPLLCLSKEDIVGYLKEERIDFIEDSTNNNEDFDRNFLRIQILPKLREKLNPSLDRTLLNSSEVLRAQKQIIDFAIDEFVKDIISLSTGTITLSLRKIKKYPVNILGEILIKIFKQNFDIEFTFTSYKNIMDLITNQVGKQIDLGKKIIAYRERGKIIITGANRRNITEETLRIGSNVKLGSLSISASFLKRKPTKYYKDGKIEYISGDKLNETLNLREWKNGDRIKLLGMKETKKISDVLTDLKVSSFERKKQLVLLNKTDIVWLVGKRISENYKITNTTKRIVKLCLR